MTITGLAAPLALIGAALANSTVAVASYFGAASLVWGIADALTSQPHNRGVPHADRGPAAVAHRPSLRHPHRRRGPRVSD
ncbi:MAG: hypothetical protein MZV49_27315 [Rhodopseudomonas palustris]|nr:hypothetical protein [Rhodopseudomonas palustris]